MKIKVLAVFLGAFGFAYGATAGATVAGPTVAGTTVAGPTAAMDDLIVCSGGRYCEDERLDCLASGQYPDLCEMRWRGCVLDACPQ